MKKTINFILIFILTLTLTLAFSNTVFAWGNTKAAGSSISADRIYMRLGASATRQSTWPYCWGASSTRTFFSSNHNSKRYVYWIFTKAILYVEAYSNYSGQGLYSWADSNLQSKLPGYSVYARVNWDRSNGTSGLNSIRCRTRGDSRFRRVSNSKVYKLYKYTAWVTL